jgi:hypothetical protein
MDLETITLQIKKELREQLDRVKYKTYSLEITSAYVVYLSVLCRNGKMLRCKEYLMDYTYDDMSLLYLIHALNYGTLNENSNQIKYTNRDNKTYIYDTDIKPR